MMLEELRPLPPIKRSVWIVLKKLALKRTEDTGKQVTLGDIIEEAILGLTRIDMNKKN